MLGCRGVVDPARNRARWTCTDEDDVESSTIVIGDTAYHGGSGPDWRWGKYPGDDQQLELLFPERTFGVLRAAATTTERVGDENVRGVPTVRYALTVDCLRAELYCDGSGVAEVWIDEEGLVRRIETDEWGATEFFDFGVPVAIEPPPADVVDEIVDYEPLPCTPEQAAPIGVQQAADALRRAGFDIALDKSNCGRGVAGHLSNLDETPAGWSTVVGADEYLACDVHTSAETAEGFMFTLMRDIPHGAPPSVERELENLWCRLYVDESVSVERTDALDAAFAELRSQLPG